MLDGVSGITVEWFDIAELAARPFVDGETHLHESAFACTSLFVHPNRSGLKGIAPHCHTHCDDIELVLRGEIAILGTPGSATLVPAHYIVINPAGSAHGYFAHAGEVIVLGVRTPKSYEGVPLLDQWRGQLGPMPATSATRLIDTADCGAREHASTHATIRIHLIEPAAECPLPISDSETILVALGPIAIVQDDVETNFHLPALGLAVFPGKVALRCRAASATTLIQICPLSAGDANAAIVERAARHV